MSLHSPLGRKLLARLAIFALAVLHLGVALAPHIDSHSNASLARPHLHAAGDALEPVHDEAACPACSGLHLATPGTAAVKLSIAPTTAFNSHDTQQNPLLSAARHRSVLSRAPPVAV